MSVRSFLHTCALLAMAIGLLLLVASVSAFQRPRFGRLQLVATTSSTLLAARTAMEMPAPDVGGS